MPSVCDKLVPSSSPKAERVWPSLRLRGNGHESSLQKIRDHCANYLQTALVEDKACRAFCSQPLTGRRHPNAS